MLSFIYSSVKPCFKSTSNTKLYSLSTAIACVALGTRSCHLVDISSLDYAQAKVLLSNLKKNPSCHSLILLQFKNRYTFICNKNRLEQHLKLTLDSNPWFYIDVQGKEPERREAPRHLTTWLEQCLVPFLKSGQDIYYSDHVFTFMVCLTGWCLEYPIIYTTHSESDGLQEEIDEWEEPKPNCLGGRSLTLIQVWLNNLRLLDERQSQYNLLSFSYPSCSLNSDEQTKLERELKLRIDRRLVNNDRHHRIKQGQCEIRREQINLERFAL